MLLQAKDTSSKDSISISLENGFKSQTEKTRENVSSKFKERHQITI